MLRNFIKRLGYFISKDKRFRVLYIAVPEYQKRRAVHYHLLLFNLPYIENIFEEISKVWKHGFIINKTVRSLDHAINYVCKYISKDILIGDTKRHFLASKGLKRPFFVRSEQELSMFFRQTPKPSEVTESLFTTVENGEVHRMEIVYPIGTNLEKLKPLDIRYLVDEVFADPIDVSKPEEEGPEYAQSELF